MTVEIKPASKKSASQRVMYLLLLLVVGVLLFIILSYPLILSSINRTLVAGSVSPRNIEAPYSFTYTSDVLTKSAITKELQNLPPVYLPANPDVSREQYIRLEETIRYIDLVREDTYATMSEKVQDLSKVETMNVSPDVYNELLGVTNEEWGLISEESLTVLSEVMKNTIQDSQVEDAKRTSSSLINIDFSRKLANLTHALLRSFIVANSQYSEELTEAAVKKIVDTFPPLSKTYVQGQLIVARGQIITPEIEEALVKYGLIQNFSMTNEIISMVALVIFSLTFIFLFFWRRNVLADLRLSSLILIVFFFLLFALVGRMLVVEHTVIPYIFPIAAFGLIIASLFTMELGVLLSVFLALMTSYGVPNSIDLTLFYALGSLGGILVLGRGLRVSSFIWAGVTIGLIGALIMVAYRLSEPYTDLQGLLTLVGAVLLNGLISASLALLLQFIFTQLFGFATPLHLIELSRSDHPLLQMVLQNAPGTYQHSLQVSNMAELAAKAIGADPYLVRAGALFHDAGKAVNPQYFIENQLGSKHNPHNDLTPRESARIILAHVTDGLALANKHRLPANVRNFINEHHGTSITRYQYTKALEEAKTTGETVDPEDFRYPGPKPQSKETALLMLADIAEAKARADMPKDEEQLRESIRKAVEFCLQQGQLNETHLTFLDINKTIDSFVFTLQNTYHPRIRYPEAEKESAVTSTAGG